jgi:beta-lactamase class A
MNNRIRGTFVAAGILALLSCGAGSALPAERGGRQDAADWSRSLAAAMEAIDAAMPGNLGVHVRKPGGANAGSFGRAAERRWYLASTVKVPVAIAVLELVDDGKLDLSEELTLRESDFVDGVGDLLRSQPGARYSIARLLAGSLEQSDSIATDLLIRRIGVEHLNARVKAWTGGGFGPITTIQQVRYDAYGPLHPGVARLTSLQMLAVQKAGAGEPRMQALAKVLGVPRAELGAVSVEEAFEAYYRGDRNKATLAAFGTILEKLIAGELLSPASTQRILDHMERIQTGDRRIKSGLPAGVTFAQKTGTQVRRACNLGAIDPRRGREGAVVVVACAERFETLAQAETAFSELGRALHAAGLVEGAQR